jgi:hypothetical protein
MNNDTEQSRAEQGRGEERRENTKSTMSSVLFSLLLSSALNMSAIFRAFSFPYSMVKQPEIDDDQSSHSFICFVTILPLCSLNSSAPLFLFIGCLVCL